MGGVSNLSHSANMSMSYASPPHAVLPTRRSRSGSMPLPGGPCASAAPPHISHVDESALGWSHDPTAEAEMAREDGREELDLMYDPMLNCYYDPRTNKYYELK